LLDIQPFHISYGAGAIPGAGSPNDGQLASHFGPRLPNRQQITFEDGESRSQERDSFPGPNMDNFL
jgi:hypothetical protein